MKNKKGDKYPVHWVRLAANQIYGSDVASSTWRKWLRLFSVPRYERSLTPEQAIYLLAYADLRKNRPNKSLGVIDVKKHIARMPYSPEKLQEKVEQGLFFNAKGKDLPDLIRQYTGKHIHIRTLYRWAKKYRLEFGASKRIGKLEIKRWIELAS